MWWIGCLVPLSTTITIRNISHCSTCETFFSPNLWVNQLSCYARHCAQKPVQHFSVYRAFSKCPYECCASAVQMNYRLLFASSSIGVYSLFIVEAKKKMEGDLQKFGDLVAQLTAENAWLKQEQAAAVPDFSHAPPSPAAPHPTPNTFTTPNRATGPGTLRQKMASFVASVQREIW